MAAKCANGPFYAFPLLKQTNAKADDSNLSVAKKIHDKSCDYVPKMVPYLPK